MCTQSCYFAVFSLYKSCYFAILLLLSSLCGRYFADKRLSERGVKAGDADEVESVQSETVQEDMDFARYVVL